MDRVLEMVIGFIASFVLAAAAAAVVALLGLGVAIVAIGLVQLIYLIPLCIYLWNRHRGVAQGLIIGAAMIFMVNSLCWGLLLQIK